MKIVVISDTHAQHRKLGHLSGDVLIHCGDMEYGRGADDTVLDDIDEWFGTQSFDLILCTGGNHDFALRERLHSSHPPFKNAIFLCDTSVTYKGVCFHGAPWVPELHAWAFYADREQLEKAWQRIVPETQVLITHGPSFGTLDSSRSRQYLGCSRLRDRLNDLENVKYHFFGHIHHNRGLRRGRNMTSINAACVDNQFELVFKPFVVDFKEGSISNGDKKWRGWHGQDI